MKRLKFSAQVKEDAVRFMRESNKSAEEVAKTVGVTAHTLRAWARQIDVDSSKNAKNALTVSEKEELSLLRRECRELRREVDFLKQAATYFAKVNK
jgi:transposase